MPHSERIYRDSVHNIIRLRIDSSEGELLGALIDSREFQRLRRIRQLGLAHYAYQSAEHSRFTHSLGAFHLATRILAKLEIKNKLKDEDKLAVRTAALLHDIGHGPFSHVIESILGFHHENFSIEAVLSDETEVGQKLSAFSPDLPQRVADIISGTFRPRSLAQLVSSQLDVDRMDYLLRDSLMTGAKYGIYDVEWIIKSLEINEDTDQLYVSAPGIYAVEVYLQARYYMFRQVYYHRTLRAAEAVLRSLLQRAIGLHRSGNAVWHLPDSAIEKVLSAQALSLQEHLSLDDSDILFHIKQWQNSDDKILSDLSERFLNRRLLKAFDLDMPEDQRTSFIDKVKDLARESGFDPEHYVIEDKGSDAAHNFYIKDEKNLKNLIYAKDGFSNPVIREISEISAAVRGLQKGYRIHRLCFPPEIKESVAKLYYA